MVSWKILEKSVSKGVRQTALLFRWSDIGTSRNIPMSRDLYSKILIEFGSILSSSLVLDTDKSVPFQALFHFDFVDRGKRAECF